MTKGKWTERQTMIYKTLHSKQKIEQYQSHKVSGLNYCARQSMQFLPHQWPRHSQSRQILSAKFMSQIGQNCHQRQQRDQSIFLLDGGKFTQINMLALQVSVFSKLFFNYHHKHLMPSEMVCLNTVWSGVSYYCLEWCVYVSS